MRPFLIEKMSNNLSFIKLSNYLNQYMLRMNKLFIEMYHRLTVTIEHVMLVESALSFSSSARVTFLLHLLVYKSNILLTLTFYMI